MPEPAAAQLLHIRKSFGPLLALDDVSLTIAPGRDAGPEETHHGDQVIYVIEGEATVTIEGAAHPARAGACVLIPAGVRHHVRNPGPGALFFLTVYAPPAY